MGAHRHGDFSFTVRIARMRTIEGDEFVAEVTGLRKHDVTGAAIAVDLPELPEQYGDSASAAEGYAVHQMRVWLTMANGLTHEHSRRSA